MFRRALLLAGAVALIAPVSAVALSSAPSAGASYSIVPWPPTLPAYVGFTPQSYGAAISDDGYYAAGYSWGTDPYGGGLEHGITFTVSNMESHDLGTLDNADYDWSQALGVNDEGTAVGFDIPGSTVGNPTDLPVEWKGGTIVDLAPTGEQGEALGIDDNGNAVGYLIGYDGDQNAQPVIFDNGGGISKLTGPADPYTPNPFYYANAISKEGQVVGEAAVSSPTPQVAAVEYNLLGLPATVLNGPAGTVYNSAMAISNNDAYIVGTSSSSEEGSGYEAVQYQLGGTGKLLGILPGYTQSFATDVNDSDVAVGYSQPADFQSAADWEATMFAGGKVIDLNSLLPADSGWKLLTANAIDDNGTIVGEGLYNGAYRGFSMTVNVQRPPNSGLGGLLSGLTGLLGSVLQINLTTGPQPIS
jgi:uncharacterized membrane protein